MDWSLAVKALNAEAAVASSILASSTSRLVRSTSTPTAQALPAPLIKSPLPVAGHHPVVDLGRAQVDADPVWELAAPVGAARAWPAGAAALAQAGDQLAAQLPARLGVDRRVEGFVRHVALRLVGVDAFEGSGNLLRRPFPVQQGAYHTPGHAVDTELARRPGGGPPGTRQAMGGLAGVAPTRRAIAGPFAADRRGRAIQRAGNGPHTGPRAGPGGVVRVLPASAVSGQSNRRAWT